MLEEEAKGFQIFLITYVSMSTLVFTTGLSHGWVGKTKLHHDYGSELLVRTQ